MSRPSRLYAIAACAAGLLLLLILRQIDAAPDSGIGALILFDSTEPRIAVALLCGAALGLSGAVLQAVLRNPLAEPTTLGTAAGAQLGIVAATLWLPLTSWYARELAASLGAISATALTCALAWRRGLSPLPLILSGLLVSLFCGAIAALFAVLHTDQLGAVFLWATGSLVQYDWSSTRVLAPQLAVAGGLLFLLARAIGILSLDDGTAQGLGLGTGRVRLAAVGLAVLLSAAVTSTVGVIGFVGLAAPPLARLAGARQTHTQLLWAPLTGALLLGLADQLLQVNARAAAMLPTGTVTALLGGPLLLVLLPRLRDNPGVRDSGWPVRRMRSSVMPWLFLLGLLALTLAVALTLGRNGQGWSWGLGRHGVLFDWRWPRVLASLAAGSALAAAGAILQRLTGNALASPEMLGLSSGSVAGVILAVLLFGAAGQSVTLTAAMLGGAAVLGALLVIGRRSGYAPQRFLLAGIAITTIMSAVTAFLLASGDVRMRMLLSWLNGSTYLVMPPLAMAAASLCAVLLASLALLARPLTILPLGGVAASAIGHETAKGRLGLLLMAAALTAIGTLVVGPLTFVGLLGPQAAMAVGFRRAVPHAVAAALLGGLVMVAADFLGRNILFPYQLPAGLLACLIGCPMMLMATRRGR